MRPNEDEQRGGGGGTFGRPTLCHTAAHQELLDCSHSKAHDFQKEWEEGCKLVYEKEEEEGGGG